jgi:hypothetical protein
MTVLEKNSPQHIANGYDTDVSTGTTTRSTEILASYVSGRITDAGSVPFSRYTPKGGSNMRRMLMLSAVMALIASVEAQKKPAPPPAGEGDIACGDQHYIVPGLCLQQCSGRRTLATPSAGQCFFAPQCTALQGDQRLKQFYNQGILHSGGPQVLPPDLAQRSVVAQIINVHYKPFNAGQFDIRIGSFAGMDAWA